MNKRKHSKILKAVHESARDLHEIGLMDETTLREFDAMCLPPVKRYTAEDIRRIRKNLRLSQPVFAAYLNVTKSTVAQWEQGEKKPRGPSLKLLDLVERKGLEVLV
jgi:putative transcriptional regulator